MASTNSQKLMPCQWLKSAKRHMQHHRMIGVANQKKTSNVRTGDAEATNCDNPSARWSSHNQKDFYLPSQTNCSNMYRQSGQSRFCGGRYTNYKQFSLNSQNGSLDKSWHSSIRQKRNYSGYNDKIPHNSESNTWLHTDHKKNRTYDYDVQKHNSIPPFSKGKLSQSEFSCASNCFVASINKSEGMTSQSKDIGENSSADLKMDSRHSQRNHEFNVEAESLNRVWIDSLKHQSRTSSVQSNMYCSVMSYNILSQTLLELNNYLYKHCDDEVLSWKFRWNNIKKELDSFKVDVLCLQEIENKHYYEDIKPWLDSRGYKHAYKKRTGHDSRKPDGVLTACLSKKFKIVETIPVEYFRPDDSSTKFHNVGLILVLQVKSGFANLPSRICIANTHLLYNPKRGDVKLIQLATLFAEINHVLKDQTAKTGSEPPLIICGDFNSTPTSPLYRLITTGELQYEGIASKYISGQGNSAPPRLMSPQLLPSCLNMKHNVCVFSKDDKTPELDENNVLRHNLGDLASSGNEHQHLESTTIQNRGITVDYIFYSNSDDTKACDIERPLSSRSKAVSRPSTSSRNNSLKRSGSKKLNLILDKRLSLCTSGQIQSANGLPNHYHSSDHLPVVAEFKLTLSKL